MPPLDPSGLEPYYVPPPVPPRDRVWLHVLLLVLTLVTTTLAGALQFFSFQSGFDGGRQLELTDLRDPQFYSNGLWYSLTILAILGCHEMGHYVACRWYRVAASLPFFLPFFLPAPMPQTGT